LKSRPEEVFKRFYKSKLLRLFLFLIGGIREASENKREFRVAPKPKAIEPKTPD